MLSNVKTSVESYRYTNGDDPNASAFYLECKLDGEKANSFA